MSITDTRIFCQLENSVSSSFGKAAEKESLVTGSNPVGTMNFALIFVFKLLSWPNGYHTGLPRAPGFDSLAKRNICVPICMVIIKERLSLRQKTTRTILTGLVFFYNNK